MDKRQINPPITTLAPKPASPPPTRPESDSDSGARPQGRRLSKKLHNRRRKAGELPTRAAAIVNHCRECVGWDSGGLGSVAAAINACPAEECWLWPYRNGTSLKSVQQGTEDQPPQCQD